MRIEFFSIVCCQRECDHHGVDSGWDDCGKVCLSSLSDAIDDIDRVSKNKLSPEFVTVFSDVCVCLSNQLLMWTTGLCFDSVWRGRGTEYNCYGHRFSVFFPGGCYTSFRLVKINLVFLWACSDGWLFFLIITHHCVGQLLDPQFCSVRSQNNAH